MIYTAYHYYDLGVFHLWDVFQVFLFVFFLLLFTYMLI